MTEILNLLLTIFQACSPIRIVHQWQCGLYYVAGKYRGTVGPGLKLVVPGLCDVTCVSLVPRIEQTPRQTVSLADGKSLTFTASLTIQVFDAALAWNGVERWQETAVELAAGALSELLSAESSKRFAPSYGKREKLRAELCQGIDELTARWGVHVLDVRFNDFVLDARPIRLLLDRHPLSEV
jgi:regulator of protease activity HflC (stomatin/prohibitin superfamily)